MHDVEIYSLSRDAELHDRKAYKKCNEALSNAGKRQKDHSVLQNTYRDRAGRLQSSWRLLGGSLLGYIRRIPGAWLIIVQPVIGSIVPNRKVEHGQ